MESDDKIIEIIEQYAEIEVAKRQFLIDKISSTISPSLIEKSKKRILKNIELHRIASEFIEDEVKKYREDLYLFSKKVASRELETDIITKSHVIKAREFIWRKRHKYEFADGYLAIGGVLSGAGITHICELIIKAGQVLPSPMLIFLGIIGAFILGMGIIAKAKQ